MKKIGFLIILLTFLASCNEGNITEISDNDKNSKEKIYQGGENSINYEKYGKYSSTLWMEDNNKTSWWVIALADLGGGALGFLASLNPVGVIASVIFFSCWVAAL
jgi:hypothetical protein